MTNDQLLPTDPWPPTPDQWLAPSAANLAEMFAGTAERGGQRTARWDDAWAADRDLPDPLVNSVTLLRPVTEDSALDLTARLDAFYREAEGGGWTLWSAWPTPDLVPLGYTLLGHPPLMVRPAGRDPAPLPAGLRIVEARNADELAAFERTFIDGYPLPALQPVRTGMLLRPGVLGGPARFWLGYVAGRLVTVAASCVGGGVVGVHFVATLPDVRGRGYGAAISDAAAQANPDLPAVLQASDLGRPVYERIGFRTVGHYTLWQRGRA